ncbi:MAG: hypothetical protein ACOCWG_06155 [bacterium]
MKKNRKTHLLILLLISFLVVYFFTCKNNSSIERNSKSESLLIIESLKTDSLFAKNTKFYYSEMVSSNKELPQLLFLRIFDNGCMDCIENQIKVSKEIIINSNKRATPMWLITAFSTKDFLFIKNKFDLGEDCYHIPVKNSFAELDSTRSSYYILTNKRTEVIDFNYLNRIKIK